MPFYGRFWLHVGNTFNNTNDPMWRVAQHPSGDFEGGALDWRNIGTMFDVSKATFHEGAKAPYIYNPDTSVFFGFENPQSIKEKVSKHFCLSRCCFG